MEVKSRRQKLIEWIGDIGLNALSVLSAVILITAYGLGWVKPDINQWSSVTLGVLSLLAITSIWDRFRRFGRLEKMAEENKSLILTWHKEVRADEFFGRDLKPDEEFFANAESIWISGITLGSTSRDFAKIIGQRLMAGAKVKIILLDTSAEVLNQIVIRSWGKTTSDYYKKRIDITSELMRIVGETPKATGSLEIGYLPFVPSFGITMVDPSESKGMAYIGIYHHNSRDGSPTFKLTAEKDPYWFHFYENQFDLMWKQCTTKTLLSDGKTANGLSVEN